MKNTFFKLLGVCLLSVTILGQANAKEESSKLISEKTSEVTTTKMVSEATSEVSNSLEEMISRLNEIKEMNIASMSSAEKKELRKEVRSIRKDLKAYGNSGADAKAVAEGQEAVRGIYLSTGALVIIVLLLILLI